MPLMLGCFALLFPRVVLFFVWALGNGYLERALHSALALILGFLFLPLTTLAYAYAVHSASAGGSLTLMGWLIVGLGVLVDLGILGGGHRGYRRRRS